MTRSVDLNRLNEAKWAACNTRFLTGEVPSMEDLSEAVENAIAAYLDMDEDEWRAQVPQ